jgi:hypothetical protein
MNPVHTVAPFYESLRAELQSWGTKGSIKTPAACIERLKQWKRETVPGPALTRISVEVRGNRVRALLAMAPPITAESL